MLLYSRSIDHLNFSLVVKPTVAPTLPPTPPPPPTIPAARDGKNSPIDFLDKHTVNNVFFPFLIHHTEYFLYNIVCKGAKADLVFLIDGSWSIGDESFSKVLQFVFSMIGAFDVVSHEGMQVTKLSTTL